MSILILVMQQKQIWMDFIKKQDWFIRKLRSWYLEMNVLASGITMNSNYGNQNVYVDESEKKIKMYKMLRRNVVQTLPMCYLKLRK